MSWPLRVTEPEAGVTSPVIRLNSVVLPAPLGPMISRRSPGATPSVTPQVTRRPPYDLHRLRTPSAVAAALSGAPLGAAATAGAVTARRPRRSPRRRAHR